MLGGGAGSIDHMIKTLRNNKLLLRSRRDFLKRRLSYAEIRVIYKNATRLIPTKEVDQKLLNEIRDKIRKHQRSLVLRNIAVAITLLLFLSVPVYFFMTYRFAEVSTSSSLINVESLNNPYSKENTANEMIRIGLLNKSKGNYFLAMGNFENALKKYPDNNKKVELLLAETVCLLCKRNTAFCPRALKVIKELKQKYPENETLVFLERNYLKK